MKIPFDIKFRPQIESGEYKVVIEYDNRTFYARIVCWDFNGTELLACVNYGDREDVLEYDSSGKHIGKSVRRPDLIIITPEPELSEFEKGYMRIVHKMKPEDFNDEGLKIAKEEAAELLELAKNEIYSHESLVEYAKTAREEGKSKALKDLPRWKPAAAAYDGDRLPRIDWMLNRLVARFEEGIYYLDIKELYKLPGFNK